MNNVHFAIPEIYGETLSYYELLRKLVEKTNDLIENYNTVPEQIAEEVKNLDASQLFSTVLNQLIHSIATDNTKSTNAVKLYKNHDLLYATFNDTVNLYESLIDFSTGTTTELIPGTNIREVNISELFIELRKLIDINKNNIEAVTAVANENSEEITTIHGDITAIENKNTEQDNELSTLRTMISSPYNFKGDVATISALPASGNINDTYYVQDVKYKVTWTGSAWVQSSLSEADYQTELNALKGDLEQLENNLQNNEHVENVNIFVSGSVSGTSWTDQPVPSRMRTPFFTPKRNGVLYFDRETNGNILYSVIIYKFELNAEIGTPPLETLYGYGGALNVNANIETTYKYRIVVRNDNNIDYVFTESDIADINTICHIKEGAIINPSVFDDEIVQKANEVFDSKTKEIIVDVNGNGDYTKITEAISHAILTKNSNVIVKKGEYDLVSEYGQSALDNTSQSTTNIFGITLDNGIHVLFESGAKVVFNYTGSNSFIHRVFSPFNAGGDFILENAHIEARNCRYCVHDERGATTEGYKHVYKNCYMVIDNTENPDWSNKQCIGGGLGDNGYVEVVSGIFDGSVTYHTTVTQEFTDATNNVVIKDNYFKNGGIAVTSTSSIKTSGKQTFLITNNSVQSSITKVDAGGVIEFIEYNNIVRN